MSKRKGRYLRSKIKKLKSNNDFISKTNKNEKWKLIIKLTCPTGRGIVRGSSSSPSPLAPCSPPFLMVLGWFLSSQSKTFQNPNEDNLMFICPLEVSQRSRNPSFPWLYWIFLIFWMSWCKVLVSGYQYIFMWSWCGFAGWELCFERQFGFFSFFIWDESGFLIFIYGFFPLWWLCFLCFHRGCWEGLSRFWWSVRILLWV